MKITYLNSVVMPDPEQDSNDDDDNEDDEEADNWSHVSNEIIQDIKIWKGGPILYRFNGQYVHARAVY